ncbi:glycosyltransferase [Microbacterium sp.]|uniref:glycosyltransferase n=1 Tax=Microbacterium sp. TaxID=51671 RepID=UPI003A851183
MPARVQAVLVVRVDEHVPVDLHLSRTLAALAAQRRPVDAISVVVCGSDDEVTRVLADSDVDHVVTAPRATTYGRALGLVADRIDADAVWLLAQDTAAEPATLARLAAALEASATVAIAAPKLVRWDDRSRIVSFGVTMTRGGRAAVLAAGELDQGQHDGNEDVLGADVRGLLVRADVWRALAGLDPALVADAGLDLGVRARLAGHRVVLAPHARVAVADDAVAAPPAGRTALDRVRAAFAERAAQLHRRLSYAPLAVVGLQWLAILPVGLWRVVADLVAKRPLRIAPDLAAAVVVFARPDATVRSRSRIRRNRATGWSQLAPLRITREQLKQRLGADRGGAADGREEAHFFARGGAWVVLAFLVASVAAFPALLAWPVLGGGALAPLRSTVLGLWNDAAYGNRPLGWSTIGPADPFSGVIAVLGSLSPWEPSRALVILWILALPLAALGGWFAASRLTASGGLRAVAGIAWALAPTFLWSLTDGRPAGVIAHLVLPWLFSAAAVAHRSWAGAGLGSLCALVVLACAPSLAPALVLLWVVAMILSVLYRHGQGLARTAWLLVPSIAVWAPLILHRLREGDLWSLLADPGVPAPVDQPTGLFERTARAAGFPTVDPGGWASLVGPDAPTWWVVLLVVPLAVLAGAAVYTDRPVVAGVLLLTALLGVTTSLWGAGQVLSATAATPVSLSPGPSLSLTWAGMTAAAILALQAVPVPRRARILAAVVTVTAIAVVALPSMTAMTRGTAALQNGPASTLPAYVEAEGSGGRGEGTFLLRPQQDGSLASTIVWGGTQTLGGQTTLISAATAPTTVDRQVARLTADLSVGSASDVIAALAEHGIGVVVLTSPQTETDAARATRAATQAALDQRDGLDHVGETGDRVLWRVTDDVVPRRTSADVTDTARTVGIFQAAAVLIAILLALPTAHSRSADRRAPRIVGLSGGRGR